MKLFVLCAVSFATSASIAACEGKDDQDTGCHCYQQECPDSTDPLPITEVTEDYRGGWWSAGNFSGTAAIVDGTVEILYRNQGVDHRVVYEILPVYQPGVVASPCSEWED